VRFEPQLESYESATKP